MIYKIYFEELDQVLIINSREKSLPASGRRRRKETFETYENTPSILARIDLRRSQLTRDLLGYYKSLYVIGEGK